MVESMLDKLDGLNVYPSIGNHGESNGEQWNKEPASMLAMQKHLRFGSVN